MTDNEPELLVWVYPDGLVPLKDVNVKESTMSDKELIERLRELASFERGVGVMQDFYCGDEMVAAADRLEALVKERDVHLSTLKDIIFAVDQEDEERLAWAIQQARDAM